jgi:hypothetical protein
MSASRNVIVVASAAFALTLAGCDPAYKYQPIGPRGDLLPQWTETIDGVRFATKPYWTLSGSRGTFVILDIVNESGKEVGVLGGQLVTKGRTIEAEILDDPPNREARTVPAGESKSVELYWDFGGSAFKVLDQDITWVWRARIGDTEHALRVPMRRKER